MMVNRRRSVWTVWAVALLVLTALVSACDSSTPSPPATPITVQTATLDAISPSPSPTYGDLPTIAISTLVPVIATQTTISAASPTDVADGNPAPSPTLMPLSNRESEFQQVWQSVKQHYLYTDFHGVNWDKTRDDYAQKVEKAASASEFYADLSDMVKSLNDDHSRYISPSAAQEEDHLDKGDDSYAGIGISSIITNNATLILQVFPGSPAEAAGLMRRDRIIAIDGKSIADGNDVTLRGPVGTQVRLTVQSPGEQPRDITLTRQKVTGKILASSSRLKVDGAIGYLLVPSLWADDMSTQVEQQLDALLAGPQLKGLVLDLRSNEGGWSTVLTGILGQFVQENVGQFYSQTSTRPLKPTPGPLYARLKNVPLVVLVDSKSESYAEVLTAALQASGRAKVVGTRSAGNTETIYAYNFADKSRLWVAQEGYKLPDGTNMEGRGVSPDVSITVDWTQYSLEKDPHVLKAIELLTK